MEETSFAVCAWSTKQKIHFFHYFVWVCDVWVWVPYTVYYKVFLIALCASCTSGQHNNVVRSARNFYSQPHFSIISRNFCVQFFLLYELIGIGTVRTHQCSMWNFFNFICLCILTIWSWLQTPWATTHTNKHFNGTYIGEKTHTIG